jgi:DNA-binding transcriptional ArsR family regulator
MPLVHDAFAIFDHHHRCGEPGDQILAVGGLSEHFGLCQRQRLSCFDHLAARNNPSTHGRRLTRPVSLTIVHCAVNYCVMTTDVATVFAALAEPKRRHVVELLSRGPMRAGDLADAAGLTPPAMSRHLRVLLGAGVVTDERGRGDARLRVFRMRPDGLAALEAWLDEQRREWDRQLESFRHHVERKSTGE